MMDTAIFSYVIVPLLIFLSRIADQTIGTIRIIFVSKGMKYLAPILGFFEVLLWLIIMRQIFQNLDNALYYISYAAGFGMGNFIGIRIEEKMAMGLVIVRIIPQKDTSKLTNFFKKSGFRFTTIAGRGAEGPVEIIFSIIKRKQIGQFTGIVKKFNPKAFYTIEDVKFASEMRSSSAFQQQDFHKIKYMYGQLGNKK